MITRRVFQGNTECKIREAEGREGGAEFKKQNEERIKHTEPPPCEKGCVLFVTVADRGDKTETCAAPVLCL